MKLKPVEGTVKEHEELTLSTENNEMVDLINRSGLQATDANVILAGFEKFFNLADEWEKEARTIIITDENCYTPEGEAAMERAGIGRKFLKTVRLDIEKVRKAEKEQSLRKGQVIDGIAKALTASASLTEAYLGKQENFLKLKAAAKVEQKMREEREKAEAIRIKQEQAEEADRIAEQERVQKENDRLKKEAEKREKILTKEREEARKEREAADEQARIEKVKADKILADERAKAEEEKAELKRQREADAAKAQERIDRLVEIVQGVITCPHCNETFTLEVPE